MKNRLCAFLIVAALAGLSGCETPPRYGEVRVHDRDYDVRVVFSDRDRTIIRDYYRSHYRGLPPGLAKQGKIPPGHAFRMQRHQGVPPGVTWESARRRGKTPEPLAGWLCAHRDRDGRGHPAFPHASRAGCGRNPSRLRQRRP